MIRMRARGDGDAAALGGVFRGIVQQVHHHLLDQQGIGQDRRQPREDLDGDPVVAQRAAQPMARAARDLAQVDGHAPGDRRPVTEARHVQRVLDVAIQPLALAVDRLGHGGARAVAQLQRGIGQGPRGPDDRHQRRARVMADRGEQRRAQPLGLRDGLRALQIVLQRDPLQREALLVGHRVQQAPVGGRQDARIGMCDSQTGQSVVLGADRQERPAVGGQRARSAPGRLAASPGIACGQGVARLQPRPARVRRPRWRADPGARGAAAPFRSRAPRRHGSRRCAAPRSPRRRRPPGARRQRAGWSTARYLAASGPGGAGTRSGCPSGSRPPTGPASGSDPAGTRTGCCADR